MIAFSRKHVVTLSLMILLVVAGYLNWSYNRDKGLDPTQAKVLGEAAYVNNDVTVSESDFFAQNKIDREKARESSKEVLNDMINNPNTDSEAKKKAQDSMIAIAKAIEDEANCEALLKAKGFTNVMVSINEEGASVSVKTDGLIPTQIAQIQEIIASETSFTGDKIKILSAR